MTTGIFALIKTGAKSVFDTAHQRVVWMADMVTEHDDVQLTFSFTVS